MATLSPDLLGLSSLLGVALGIFVTTVIGRTVYLLTHPPRRTYASAVSKGKPGDPSELSPPDGPRRFETWTFTSRGNTLTVWDIPGDAPTGPVVIMSHGWGDSKLGALSRLEPFARHASRIIAWDLPGHGESQGTTALGTHEIDDLLALIAMVRTPNVEIVLYGWSLGAGISIAAAAADVRVRKARIAGVIAEAPYRLPQTPAKNVLREKKFPYLWNTPPAFWLLGLDLRVGLGWTRKGPFDRAVLAERLECPLLVIHGENDSISPIDDGRQIAAGSRQATMIIAPGGGHSGLWNSDAGGTICRRALREFFTSLKLQA
jgi:pimeloyl-ACP methyl ester carboxylesterase